MPLEGAPTLRGKVDLRDPASARSPFASQRPWIKFQALSRAWEYSSPSPCRLFWKRAGCRECPAPFVPGQQSAVHG